MSYAQVFPNRVKEDHDSRLGRDSWILMVDWGFARQVVEKEYSKQRQQDRQKPAGMARYSRELSVIWNGWIGVAALVKESELILHSFKDSVEKS